MDSKWILLYVLCICPIIEYNFLAILVHVNSSSKITTFMPNRMRHHWHHSSPAQFDKKINSAFFLFENINLEDCWRCDSFGRMQLIPKSYGASLLPKRHSISISCCTILSKDLIILRTILLVSIDILPEICL